MVYQKKKIVPIIMYINKETMMENRQLMIQLNGKKRYLKIKRLTDILLALSGLILLAPIFLSVYLSIKISEPKAPVFFKQIRAGKEGQEFEMYKFRTMQVNAEKKLAELLQYNEIEGAMFKMKKDPRITKIGGFLRKTSLDEFPQLVNVLKGEMSLIGPRPPLPREVEKYSAYDSQRLTIMPGCTGLWQVSGRNELTFNQMVELDLSYIQNLSFILDLKILIKTFFVILVPKNAY